MDPITQGVIGATLVQATMRVKKHVAVAGFLGLLGGMAADLDVVIRSSADPLLFLEYHRQFTHSLVFIPFGGLVCALFLFYVVGRRRQLSFLKSWLYCSLGYATHALLDACTSYGTQLLWPFSHQRFAWNTMPIVDPLYTLPILGLVLLSAIKKNFGLARVALVWVLLYPCMGLLQRDRAVAAGWLQAAERGHQPMRLEAKPSFGNLLLWKVIYETEQNFYVDAVRVATSVRYYPGETIEKLNIRRDFSWLDPLSQQAKDIERFRWFSNGYLARSRVNPNQLIDVRYSLVPNEIAPLWWIELSPNASLEDHVEYYSSHSLTPQQKQRFSVMLFGG